MFCVCGASFVRTPLLPLAGTSGEIGLGAGSALLSAWLVRMIWTGWTGRQDYDPIVYALTDRWGVAMILSAMSLLVFGAW